MKRILFILLAPAILWSQTTSLSNLRLQRAYLTPGQVDKITVEISCDYGNYRRSESIYFALSDTEDFQYYDLATFYIWRDGETGVETVFDLPNRRPSGTTYVKCAIGVNSSDLIDITPATSYGDPWTLSTAVTITDGTAPVKLVFYDTTIDTDNPVIRWSGGGPDVATVSVDVTDDRTNTWLPGNYDHYSFLYMDSGYHTVDLSGYEPYSQIFFRIQGVLFDGTTTDWTGTSVIYKPVYERTWNIPWVINDYLLGSTKVAVMSQNTNEATTFRIGIKEDVPPPYSADVTWRYLTVYPGEMFIQDLGEIFGFDIQGKIATITATEMLDVVVYYDTIRHGVIPLQDSWVVPEGSSQDWRVFVRSDLDHRIAIVIGNHDTSSPGITTDVGWTFYYRDIHSGAYSSVSGSARIEAHKNAVVFLDDWIPYPSRPESFIGSFNIHNNTNIPIGVVLSSNNLILGEQLFTFMAGVQVK